jgi:hypothetical protein
MGPAGEWPSRDRANFGGTFAVEKSIIENWLEMEVGLTALGTNGQTELSGDIIFKKPFRISPTFEFMVGVGPSISRALNGEDQSTTVSAACSGPPLTSAGSLSQPGPSILETASNHSPQALGCSLGFRSDSRKSGGGGLYSRYERKLLS